MANIQVKNIPESLHRPLRRYARQRRTTLSEIVLEAIERELARRTFHDRLSKRATSNLGVPAASFLEAERRQRGQEVE